MKPLDVTGGTFILGGTFQKNFCKGHLVRLLETVRLFGSGQYIVRTVHSQFILTNNILDPAETVANT